MKKAIVIILHTIIMILSYSAPFWLDWRLMGLGVMLYYLQVLILGGCILTFAQFGKWDESFTGHGIVSLASAFGIKLNGKSVRRFLNMLPPVFWAMSIIYQVILNHSVLTSLNNH